MDLRGNIEIQSIQSECFMKDSKFVLAACALSIALGGKWTRGAEPDTVPPDRGAKEFCVAGYLPDYRVNEVDPAAAESLSDLIYFSIQPSAEGEVQAAKLSAATLEKLQTLKGRGKLRLLIAVGGWDRSKGFAPMATNPQTRHKFIANLTAFCRQRNFDGVDFDWEHPANRAEEEAYAALLVETSEAMHRENKIVTIAMAAWQHLEPKAFAAVDRIHLMAYDHDGRRHSTFERAQADVERLIEQGARPGKICLGLPFYGRGMDDRSQVKTYAELAAMGDLAAEVDEAAAIYFNGPATIQKKTRYARDRGLAGVMIWELGQDAAGGGSLLRAIKAVKP